MKISLEKGELKSPSYHYISYNPTKFTEEFVGFSRLSSCNHMLCLKTYIQAGDGRLNKWLICVRLSLFRKICLESS